MLTRGWTQDDGASACLAACPAGTVRGTTRRLLGLISSCNKCTQCSGRTITISGCDGGPQDSICYRCNATLGEYQDNAGATACKNVTRCLPGQAETQAPTDISDRTCRNCDGATEYQGEADASNCIPV